MTDEIQSPPVPTPEAPTVPESPRGFAISGSLTALSWCLKHWKLLALGITLAAFAATYFVQDIKIKRLENQRDALQLDVKFWKEEKDKCSSNFDDLAKKVYEASENSKKMLDGFDKFKEEIELSLRTRPYKPSEDIRNKPTPADCKAAMQFMRDHLDELKWEE